MLLKPSHQAQQATQQTQQKPQTPAQQKAVPSKKASARSAQQATQQAQQKPQPTQQGQQPHAASKPGSNMEKLAQSIGLFHGQGGRVDSLISVLFGVMSFLL